MYRRKRRSVKAFGILILLLIAYFAIFLVSKDFFSRLDASALTSYVSKTHETAHAQDVVQAEESDSIALDVDLLLLVNKDNKLPDDYKVNLTTIDSVKVAEVVLPDLKEMRYAAEVENIFLYMHNAYRTDDEQKKMFNQAVSGYVKQGNSRNIATQRAELVAAYPGYSEHQTGLAIDFSYGVDAAKQAEMWSWLYQNAYNYGFILRYPEGKEEITGYTYEPWHYRYVGREHAKAIHEQGLLLEEYLCVLK